MMVIRRLKFNAYGTPHNCQKKQQQKQTSNLGLELLLMQIRYEIRFSFATLNARLDKILQNQTQKQKNTSSSTTIV